MPVVTRLDHENVQRRALLVLGMHRSGTSALTGLLVRLGAHAPRHLVPPDASNPLGFWESAPLVAFHDRILNFVGSSWDGLAPLTATWLDAATAEFGTEFHELLREEFEDAPLLAVKDPRLCRLVPFWLRHLRREEIEPVAILSLRNPFEVAQSLEALNGPAREHALMIWLRHVLDAEFDTRSIRRSIVGFDDLIEHWPAIAGRISVETGVAWPAGASGAGATVTDFLRPELRHHRVDFNQLQVGPVLSGWLTQSYQALGHLAGDKAVEGRQAQQDLDRVRQEFDHGAGVFAQILERERWQLRQHLFGVKQEHASLATTVSSLEAERDRFVERATALEIECDRLAGFAAALEAERDRLAGHAAALESDRDELRHQMSFLDTTQRRLDLQVVDLERESEGLRLELRSAQKYIADLLGSASWRVTAPLRTAAEWVGLTAASLITAKAVLLREHFYGALEAPADGSLVVDGTLEICGWALSRGDAIARVEAFIDRFSLGLVPFGLERSDVALVFRSRPAEGSGYRGTIVLDQTLHGPHTLRVQILDRRGRLREYRRRIAIRPAAAAPTVEEPKATSHVEERLPGEMYARPRLDNARPASPEPRFLVVTDAIPTPDLDSGSVRLFQMLKVLAELGYSVTLMSHSEERSPQYIEPLAQLGIDVFFGREAAIAHLMTEGHRYRYVLLSRPEIAFMYLFPVRAGAINATVAYDMVDLHWLRWQRAAEVLADEPLARQSAESKQVERFNALGSDIVIAITESEKRFLLEDDPSLSVEIIPNIHALANAAPVSVRSRRDLMFIGGFQHAPNEDAVCYFVHEIWPLVTRELPGVVFNIVGSRSTEQVRELESSSVRVVGYVPDPAPYFAQSRVFVSPLRYGAGMKGKIGQSMSFGLPVVTTSIGAEGMLLVDAQNALIADGPDDFARAVVRLYRDEVLWRHIATNSVTHIQQHFSPAEARRRISAIFPISASINHRQTVVAK